MENALDLSPGADYPRTFQEVDEWFRSDAACREYIRRLRWPGGSSAISDLPGRRRTGVMGIPYLPGSGQPASAKGRNARLPGMVCRISS